MVDRTWYVVYRNGRFYRDITDVSAIDKMTITMLSLWKKSITPAFPRPRVSPIHISSRDRPIWRSTKRIARAR